MPTSHFVLEFSRHAQSLVDAGKAYFDGGVIRERSSGRIVEILSDAGASKSSEMASLVAASVVPMAVLGVSMMVLHNRLRTIDLELRKLNAMIESLSAEVKFANVKLDGLFFGNLIGDIHACHLDIISGNHSKLDDYRRRFLVSYHQFHQILQNILTRPELMKKFEPVITDYYKMMLLAGIAARDLSLYLDEPDTAIDLTRTINKDISSHAESLKIMFTTTPGLFWCEPRHRELVHYLRTGSSRLQRHEEMLREIPMKEIKGLVEQGVQLTD